MTPDDLFVQVLPGAWGAGSREADTDLLRALIDGPSTKWADPDVASVLAEQISDDLIAWANEGGPDLGSEGMALALRALGAVLGRLGVDFRLPFRDYPTFKRHYAKVGAVGTGSYAKRRDLVADLFDPLMERLDRLRTAQPAAVLAEPALSALTDREVINDHLKRLNANADADPRLAVSAAKDLVESTAKLILTARGLTYTRSDDLPALASRAQRALLLHADQPSGEATKPIKRILGALYNSVMGLAELRNDVGVGHGRETVPTWVKPRHARLAAGAANTWCNLMLETLDDPDAPWRKDAAGAAAQGQDGR